MWASREMTSKEDREIFVRTTIRELIVYLIFLVVFCFCKCFLNFWIDLDLEICCAELKNSELPTFRTYIKWMLYLWFLIFSNFWHGIYTNVFLHSSDGKFVQRLWRSWTSNWFLGCKLLKIQLFVYFFFEKKRISRFFFQLQFMEGSMLDGIYWEYLYNDGTDKRFVCLHFLCRICLHFLYTYI